MAFASLSWFALSDNYKEWPIVKPFNIKNENPFEFLFK
jgi:hypothetical protein